MGRVRVCAVCLLKGGVCELEMLKSRYYVQTDQRVLPLPSLTKKMNSYLFTTII